MSNPSFPGGPWTGLFLGYQGYQASQQLSGDGAGKSIFAMIVGGLELAGIVVFVLAALANSHG